MGSPIISFPVSKANRGVASQCPVQNCCLDVGHGQDDPRPPRMVVDHALDHIPCNQGSIALPTCRTSLSVVSFNTKYSTAPHHYSAPSQRSQSSGHWCAPENPVVLFPAVSILSVDQDDSATFLSHISHVARGRNTMTLLIWTNNPLSLRCCRQCPLKNRRRRLALVDRT